MFTELKESTINEINGRYNDIFASKRGNKEIEII